MTNMYRITTINFDDCCALYIKISQEFDNRSVSPHAAQHKLCRDILSTESFVGCLSSPMRDLTQMLVVGTRSILDTPDHPFQSWLRNEHLQVVQCARADGFTVEQCFRFSMSVWLEAQQWYRVGDCLVQGGFLQGQTTNLCRIAFQVHCASSGDVFLRISSETVRFFVLEQWQLSADGNMLESGTSIQPRWVTCLPKLGRGRVVAAHRGLPAHSPFANYREMRAYWKNCYGYDLPTGEPEIYYDVLFNGCKNSFLYPFFCVLSSEPETIRFRDDRETTLQSYISFTQALAAAPRHICGQIAQVHESSAEECRIHAALLNSTVVNKKKAKSKPGNFRPVFSGKSTRPPATPGSMSARPSYPSAIAMSSVMSPNSVVSSEPPLLSQRSSLSGFGHDIADESDRSDIAKQPSTSEPRRVPIRPTFGRPKQPTVNKSRISIPAVEVASSTPKLTAQHTSKSAARSVGRKAVVSGAAPPPAKSLLASAMMTPMTPAAMDTPMTPVGSSTPSGSKSSVVSKRKERTVPSAPRKRAAAGGTLATPAPASARARKKTTLVE